MGLSLPVAHEAIRSNYRNLAKKWHPDLNPSDADSTRKMQALNRAFSILTGIDPLSLQLQAREVVDYRRTKPDLVIDSGLIKLEISFGDSPPLDWIYTSSFAADREHIFVGSYAGKIVKLDALGVPIAAIDVASVPRSIFDIGQYLYILTDTRMYVVGRNYELVNLIDIHQRGKLITAPQGFGLMANKSLQWYSLSGEESTEIRTKHPIRAAYYTGSGIIVETRQHRARFAFV